MQKNNEKKYPSKGPIIETFVSRSVDGKWVIHKTVITDVKPVSYYDKVLEAEDSKESSDF